MPAGKWVNQKAFTGSPGENCLVIPPTIAKIS